MRTYQGGGSRIGGALLTLKFKASLVCYSKLNLWQGKVRCLTHVDNPILAFIVKICSTDILTFYYYLA